MLDANGLEAAAKATFAKANEGKLKPETIESLWPSQHLPHWSGLAEAAITAYLQAVGPEPEAWQYRWQSETGEWSGWIATDLDPNDWVWPHYWKDIESRPLYSALVATRQPSRWWRRLIGQFLKLRVAHSTVLTPIRQKSNEKTPSQRQKPHSLPRMAGHE